MDTNNLSLAQQLAQLLVEKHLKVAVAESCTGGGLAYQFTAVPGSGDWFERGFVVYSNIAKMELLEVRADTLAAYGSVSEQTALEMVTGTLLHSHADFALSITGIAGPGGGTPDRPVGTVWFGLASRQQLPQAKQVFLTGGREQIRHDAIGIAIAWLLQELR